jgi:hypothetical protein
VVNNKNLYKKNGNYLNKTKNTPKYFKV